MSSYRTYGNPGDATLVADIAPGPSHSMPEQLTTVGAHVYCSVLSQAVGREIWRSDGTSAGTQSITGAGPWLSVRDLVSFQGELYFTTVSPSGLWAVDSAGTVRPISSAVWGSLLAVDDILFVWSSNGLWAFDGVTAQLRQLTTSSCVGLTALGSRAVFWCLDLGLAAQPWVSDGTVGGTMQLATIPPGTTLGVAQPRVFTRLGSRLVFFADDGTGVHPWVTDGTVAGTQRVTQLSPSTTMPVYWAPRAFRGHVYFLERSSVQPAGFALAANLWRTDGTASGTSLVMSGLQASELGATRDALYIVNDDARGRELWVSDGSAANTRLVVDLNPGAVGSNPTELFPATNGNLFFVADDGATGDELWRTDGTVFGTVLTGDLVQPLSGGASSSPRDAIAAFGGVLFWADDGVLGREPWFTSGQASGTRMLKDLNPGAAGSTVGRVSQIADGRGVFFSAADAQRGNELWFSDGTEAGTRLVKDIHRGSSPSYPDEFVFLDDLLLFRAHEPTGGAEMWRSDGTPAGTTWVRNLAGAQSSNPRDFTVLGDVVLFLAFEQGSLLQLWRTDGTSAGTSLITQPSVTGPSALVRYRDSVLWGRSDGIWRTDGTVAGTLQIATAGWYDGFAVANDLTFFSARDSGGVELWCTDGTAGGTRRVADIESGPGNSAPRQMTVVGDRVFFTAITSAFGEELWVSDGTAAGTRLVADLEPGPAGIRVRGLEAVGTRRLALVLTRPTSGTGLWVTDGTAGGTFEFGNIASATGDMHFGAGFLFFAGGDGSIGSEPWAWRPGATARPLGRGCGAGLDPVLRCPDPVLGTTLSVVGDFAPIGVPALLLASGPRQPSWLGRGGCTSYLDAWTVVLLANVVPRTARWSVALPLPATPALLGLRVALQSIHAPTPDPLGFALSNGIDLHLGF